MNKENFLGVENQPSTEIHDSVKGYSSRYQKIKKQKKQIDPLPYQLERAAIAIQRFWRCRQIIKNKLYQKLLSELESSNCILEFENGQLKQMLGQYQCEAQRIHSIKKSEAEKSISRDVDSARNVIKQCVLVTFRMEKQVIPQNIVEDLENKLSHLQAHSNKLQTQRELLRRKVTEDLHIQEERHLAQIRDLNFQLLQVVAQRTQLQLKSKQKMIETSKFGLMAVSQV